MKTKFNLLWSLLLVAAVAMGAKITDNILSIGDGNPATDKKIDLSDGEIKWDQATSKLQFSNDNGSSFKDLGTGGGGGAAGVNLFDSDDNADFEALTLTPWAASGGSFVIESGVPGFGLQSGLWDSSAASETLDSALKTVELGLENRSCNATLQYKYASGSSGDYKLQVLDSVATVIAETDLGVSADWRKEALQFTCPSAEQVRVRITSTVDGGSLLLDNVTLGKSDFVDISQTELLAHAHYEGTANCSWVGGGASFTAMSPDADCPAITVNAGTASVDTTDDDLPTLVLNDPLKSGTYVIEATFVANSATASTPNGYRLRETSIAGIMDGNNSPECSSEINAGDVMSITCSDSFVVTATTTSAPVFSFESFHATGTNLILNDDDGRTLSYKLVRYPLASAEAISLETVGEYWNVSIGGANPSLQTSNVNTYSQIINSSLDLVVNSGSKSAEIPCSGTNPSTGLTCSAGNESIGIVVDVATAGRYKVCFQGSVNHNLLPTNNTYIDQAFQWVETPNNAQTILQEGQGRINLTNRHIEPGGSNLVTSYPLHVCGNFTLSSAGQKTFRLFYEQNIVGNGADIVTNVMAGDRNSNVGQRDFNITVEKLDQQMPTPVFTELQNLTAGGTKKKSCSLMFGGAAKTQNCTSTCTLHTDLDGCVSSITRLGTGNYKIDFNSNYFPLAASDGDVVCQGSAFQAGVGPAALGMGLYDFATNSVTFFTAQISSGAALDTRPQVFCEGAR